MTIQLPIIGDGSSQNPFRIKNMDLVSEWTNNGDGTATVVLNEKGKQRKKQEKIDVSVLMVAIESNNSRLKQRVPVSDLTENQMQDLLGFYPSWEDVTVGNNIKAGTLITYDGALFRTVQAHGKQFTWAPPTAKSLFTEETPPGTIPAWTQPAGAHDAYEQGFIVEHNDLFYESDVDANVWEPPQQWTEIPDPTA